jgi:hypothetical protein
MKNKANFLINKGLTVKTRLTARELKKIVDGWNVNEKKNESKKEEEYEERAAILEFETGLPRAEAERRAYLIVFGRKP